MSLYRRRGMQADRNLLPREVNDLRTWKNERGYTQLDIDYSGNTSKMYVKQLLPGVDSLSTEITITPNRLYRLTFDYEVKDAYTLYAGAFGLHVYPSGKPKGIQHTASTYAYNVVENTPTKASADLYFYPTEEKVTLYLNLTAINDDQHPTFTFGNFRLTAEEFPRVIESDAHRDARILTSGKGATMMVTHTGGEVENILLPAGVNVIPLPEEVGKITFTPATAENVVWADFGNVRSRNVGELCRKCYRLIRVYGITLSATNSLTEIFNGCAMLEHIGRLDVSTIMSTTWLSFLYCERLRYVGVANLGKIWSGHLDLRYSSMLSVDCVREMIANAAEHADSRNTIVNLHKDVRDKLTAEDIARAAAKKIEFK